ncbi:DNA-binding domain-containing protein [Hoeflea prorocentri]|uniref:DNA-binding domain-containing protein n=1 Tax=Hoeflea prorocentri TaxID=1922333 RepID=A0A9X3ZFU4_9HYPH|nr:DNA-binding domain-containing protein [Hoeflea prorocentri]MCY6379242.1 DNA-binding domain-containing protein [Hoeflea prorocentri]MDA5397043.1 DNA-binding domain-containing protein [Hoeflea prorocentri]
MPQPDNDAPTEKADRPVPLVRFSEALLDPDLPKPEGIIGPQGKNAVKRFNVYRNNVTVGLINALADIYPAVHRIVGDRFFRSMAKIYVQTEQPSSPLLFRYGAGFPAFLETFEPVRELVYLPDVARLERKWLDAFHAADRPVLGAEELAAVAPEDLALQSFAPHPAAHIIRSPFAAVSIFSANRAGEDPSGIKTGIAEDGLITRREFDVEVRHLPPGGAAFLQALISGQTLGGAAGAAAAEAEDFDLAAAITAMLEAGVFCGLATDKKTEESISDDIVD